MLLNAYFLLLPVAATAVLTTTSSQPPNFTSDDAATCVPQIQTETVTKTVASLTVTVTEYATGPPPPSQTTTTQRLGTKTSSPRPQDSTSHSVTNPTRTVVPSPNSSTATSQVVIDTSDGQLSSQTIPPVTTPITETSDGAGKTSNVLSETATSQEALPSTTHTTTSTETPVPSPWSLDLTIEDETYHLPAEDEDPIELLLLTGAILTIGPDEVLLNDKKVSIPNDISDTQTLSVDGVPFTVGPPSGNSGGGGGSGSLLDILSDLGNSAKSVSSGLQDIIDGGKSLAKDGATEVIPKLTDTFNSVTDSLESITNTLRNTLARKDFELELEQLTSEGRQIFKAYPELEKGFDITKSLKKLIHAFPRLRNNVVKRMTDNWLLYTGATGALVIAEEAARGLAGFDFTSTSQPASFTSTPTTTDPTTSDPTTSDPTTSDPTTSIRKTNFPTFTKGKTNLPTFTKGETDLPDLPTISIPETTTPITTATESEGETSSTRTSTSTSATPTPYDSDYLILAKSGLSTRDFEGLVDDIDGGAGIAIGMDVEEFPKVYFTHLNASQAEDISKLDSVNLVRKEPPVSERPSTHDQPMDAGGPVRRWGRSPHDDEYEALNHTESKQNIAPRGLMTPRPNSPHHLKLLSHPWPGEPGVNGPSDDYVADESLGAGVTIYIIDTGLNETPEFSKDGRDVTVKVAPNDLALPNIPESDRKPEDRWDWKTHGTPVAAVAAGKHYGVASKANIYMWKYSNSYYERNSNGGRQLKHGNGSVRTSLYCLEQIIKDIRKRENQGKAVVNLSFSIPKRAGDVPLFEKAFEILKNEDAVVVVAAANRLHGSQFLDDKVPTALGRDDNGLVTVGSVGRDGNLVDFSVPEWPGRGGSITLYAQGENVQTISGSNPMVDSGTSLSSPIVAGLAAYFLAHPEYRGYFRPGNVQMDMKKFLVDSSFQRVQTINRFENYGQVEWLNVAYNLARGPFHSYCTPQFFLKRGLSEDSTCVPLSSTRHPTSTSSAAPTSATSTSAVPTSVPTTFETSFKTSMKPSETSLSSPTRTEITRYCTPFANPHEGIQNCHCASGGYQTHLPYLTSTDDICGYTSYPVPVTTTAPPTTTESEYSPYTQTDPMGNIIVCESSVISELKVNGGVTATLCGGPSTTISTAPAAQPTKIGDVTCFTGARRKINQDLLDSIDDYCWGQDLHATILSVGGRDYKAGALMSYGRPGGCMDLFTSEISDSSHSLCTEPLKKIIETCPSRSGQIDNDECGLWWLDNCPAGMDCERWD